MQIEYELRPSRVAGTGIFTTAPIKRGALLWLCNSESVRTHDEESLRKRLADLPPKEQASACTSSAEQQVHC
eukprot:SAG31_NODE_621_length_13502_cov_18.057002_8_plen_72_part_00